jgi:hypothetical protein
MLGEIQEIYILTMLQKIKNTTGNKEEKRDE